MSDTTNSHVTTTTSAIWQILGRLIASSIIFGITAFFTPDFTINNLWTLVIFATILPVIDYCVIKFTDLHLNSFSKGLIGFIIATITLYITQFFVSSYSISWISAIVGASIYGVIDYFMPENL